MNGIWWLALAAGAAAALPKKRAFFFWFAVLGTCFCIFHAFIRSFQCQFQRSGHIIVNIITLRSFL